MKNEKSIADYLAQIAPGRFSIEELQRLKQLAGVSIANADFYADVERSREAVGPTMPIFSLPAGSMGFRMLLHLRPSDVASGRLAFMRFDEEDLAIEVAGSLAEYAFYALASEEALGNEDGEHLPSFLDAVERANQIFGAGFYEAGRHGNFKGDDVKPLMVKLYGGSPAILNSMALSRPDPRKKLELYEIGIKNEPGCLKMYSGAVSALVDIGDSQRAAELLARSLQCYHHTAYNTDIEHYYELGRRLLAEHPRAFSDEERWEVTTPDPLQRARRAGELFEAGETERADKLLNDCAWDVREYAGYLDAFRKDYQRLGWGWALALCDLRR